MDATTVPEEGGGMQYVDPDGRPSPTVEALTSMLAATALTFDDRAHMIDVLESQRDVAVHQPWCTAHEADADNDWCAMPPFEFGPGDREWSVWTQRLAGEPTAIVIDGAQGVGLATAHLTVDAARVVLAALTDDALGFTAGLRAQVAAIGGEA